MERLKLASDQQERDRYDSLADLFSIIVTLEHLEKAFVRDCCVAAEYDQQCKGLISKYKTLLPLVADAAPSLDHFLREYGMSCPAAASRLQKGITAIQEHGGGGAVVGAKRSQLVFQAGQHFITLMDCLKLGQVIQP